MKKRYLVLLAAGCVAANAANVNYDLLGRKGSKMNSPMVYRNVDYSKTQKSEQQKLSSTLGNGILAKQASGLIGGAKAIVGTFTSGTKKFRFRDCSDRTSGCGEVLSVSASSGDDFSTYLKEANEKFINIISQQKPRFSPEYSFVTAGPTRCYLSGFDAGELSYNVYGNVTYTSSFKNNLQITYTPIDNVKNKLNRNSNTILSNTNVGIYFDEEAVPVRLNPNVDAYAPFILADNASKDDFNTMPGYEMRASRMYRLVHEFSNLSAVYAAKGQPSNPADTANGPQIYMGLHAYGGQAKSSYSAAAKELDNYIYNNRTVEIVGAGNSGGNFSSKAFAVNAITVGAKDPITNNTASYSAKNLPKYCSNCETYYKPEIEIYSNFYTNDYYRRYVKSNQLYEYYPYYDGTEAAAGVTAGMISDMLSYNEFYKWHPEVVKAVLLNASKREPLKYDRIVSNQIHHSYYFIGDVNKITKKYNDHPKTNNMNEEQYDGKKEFRLNFGRSALGSSGAKGFCATIAWLNSGNDIAKLGKLPQNFEIFGYKRYCNKNCYNDLSHNVALDDASVSHIGNENDPYKTICVDSSPTEASHEFTVRIVLDEDDTRSENYGQMVLGLDIMPFFN